MIETPVHIVPTSTIVVLPDRQRKETNAADDERLKESILSRGLIHPIILRKADNSLVVGERRFRAWQKLETLPKEAMPVDYTAGIPARYIDEMRPDELKAIELEENLQRKDLSWQDSALAFLDYYEVRSEMYVEEQREAEGLNGLPANGEGEHPGDPDYVAYTWAMMGGDLNCSDSHCCRMVKVGRALRNGDKEVLSCDSARAAGALLDRRARRIAENELVTFGEVERRKPVISLEEISASLAGAKPEEIEEPDISYEVLQADWRQFVEEYRGQRFNFVHCDFPFGKGLHESDLYKTEGKATQYKDTEDRFWECCQALVDAQDEVLSASCHIFFWFPMDKYTAVLEYFHAYDFWIDPYPYIWVKSDKMGILPDPTRGGRRIYESALVMSLGDRKIIKPTVNAAYYPSESATKEHVSQKVRPMLEDFFRMFIDKDSVVLDPTCGSGTALAAAIKLGAGRVVGLDDNPSCVELAEDNARNAFTLKIKE